MLTRLTGSGGVLPRIQRVRGRIAVVVALLLAAMCPAVPGLVPDAMAQQAERTITVSGTLLPMQSTVLGSQVNGRVERVLVDVGDRVQRGQPLVQLDRVFFEIEVAQRKAALSAATVSLEDARRNLVRMKELFERPKGVQPAISQKQYEDAITAQQAAAARVEESRAALRGAEQRMAEATIRAPYDGVVTQRFIDPGESITATPVTRLVEVQSLATLKLEFSLPQKMLANVRTGTPVRYRVSGAGGVQGETKVQTVYPVIDEATRTFRCRALVKNTGGMLLPGTLVEVLVELDAPSGP